MTKELTKKKIEEIAVNKVEDLCNSFSRLESFINKNDKTPSIDGQIVVRKHPSEKKEDILDFITVQIKGTQVNKLSTKEISFDVDIADLKNFLLFDGVIFLVVEIINNNKFRIFYNTLLPYDIHVLLKNTKKDQKQKRMKLNRLDKNKFYKICNTFIYNKNEQKGIPCRPNEDIKKLKDFKFPFSNYLKNGLNYLLNNEVYIKAYQTELKQQVIVDKVQIVSIDEHSNAPIYINDEEYYKDFTIKHKKDSKIILIGKCIEILMDKKGTLCQTTFSLKGNLYERIQDLEFMLVWNAQKKLKIGNLTFEIVPNDEYRGKLNESLKILQEARAMFEYLNVRFNVDLDHISFEETEKIQILINTIFYNKGEIKQTAPIQAMKVKISNVNIAIVVSNESGTQKVYNYFELHKKLKTTVKDDSGNVYLIPTYNELDANLWLQFNNFNIEAFEESIKDCDLSEVAMDKSINIFLQMLKCYDMTLEPKYLECCQRTAQYLLDSYPESITVLINYYQTIKRIRALTKDEKNRLIDLRQHTNDDCALACISIILDNITDYEYYFERLDDDTKSQFVKWPIYSMVHNHNAINNSLCENNNELISV